MREGITEIIDFVRQDPLPVLGLLLLSFSGVLLFRIHRKLQQIGDKSYELRIPSDAAWTVPRAYLKARLKQGWSPLPAYAVWGCAVFGIIIFVIGLFKL